MDYRRNMTGSPIYEFDYSGHHTSSGPDYNSGANDLLMNFGSSANDMFHDSPSTFTVQSTPHLSLGLRNNTVVYQVPDYVPLDAVLQKLGVDLNSLHRTSEYSNHYISSSLPMHHWNIPPSSHHRQNRRRMVCYETTDSSDDDADRYSSHSYPYRHHRRHHRHYHRRNPRHADDYDHYGQAPRGSPTQNSNALENVWRKTEQASQNLSQGNNQTNFNSQWQGMRNSSPPLNNAWQAMQNTPGPMPSQEEQAVRNVWNRAAGASNGRSNFLSNMFNRMEQAPGQFNQSSPPPPANQAAVGNFFAARHLPAGVNQPYSPVANAWSRAENAAPNYPPSPPANRAAIGNFLAARHLPAGVSQPYSAVGNAWNRADNAAQNLPPPPSAVNSVWNQIQQSPPPQPSAQQPFYPQGSAASSAWNRLQQNPGPPPYSPYSQPPMSGLPSGPNVSSAPASFGALLSRAHQQQLPYAGAAYPSGGRSY